MKVQDHISPIEQYVIDFVRKFRLTKKLSQEDVGNIIEVSRSYIGDIESSNSRAKYNLTHINSLADYFNISPQTFLPEKPLISKAVVSKASLKDSKENKTKGISKNSKTQKSKTKK